MTGIKKYLVSAESTVSVTAQFCQLQLGEKYKTLGCVAILTVFHLIAAAVDCVVFRAVIQVLLSRFKIALLSHQRN